MAEGVDEGAGYGDGRFSPPARRPRPRTIARVSAPRRALAPSTDESLSRFERRRLVTIWLLVFVSSLPLSDDTRAIFVPVRIEQAATAGALGLAFLLALMLNRRLRFRDTGFLVAYALLPIVSIVPVLLMRAGLGSMFRTGRFFLALLTLALTSPWWRSGRWVLLDAHLKALRWCVVAAWLFLPVGWAFNTEGRLWGNFPALAAPQLGQFAAVMAGIYLLLALSEDHRPKRPWFWVVAGVVTLLLTQTRTALAALVVGVALGIAVLVGSQRRTRMFVAVMIAALPFLALMLTPWVNDYWQRGQSEELQGTLTGRTVAWEKVGEFPRDMLTEAFGIGLTDKSIEGLPIDNGYLAVYHEQGRVGLVMVGVIALVLFTRIVARRGPPSAIGIFVLGYTAVSSYTETGIGDMSSYVMHLVAAAVVLTPRMVEGRR